MVLTPMIHLHSKPLSCSPHSKSLGQQRPAARRRSARTADRRDMPVQAIRDSGTQHSRSARSPGWSWIPNGAILAAGGASPGLLLAATWQQVSAWGPVYQAGTLLAVDALFILTASVFLSFGSHFGRQRYGLTMPYPGPFVEADGSRRPPSFFKAYVISLPVTAGILLPAAGFLYLILQGRSYLATATLGVYLLELAAQLVSEQAFIKQESAMWGQGPQVYQVYRVWQLIRGCSLVQQMGGAGWLWTLQAMLIMLWVFNFGVVCTWTPWLYRWHLQPSQAAICSKND